MAPKITLYGILLDVRVSSKMEKKIQPTSNFICIASPYKTKMYAMCASYGFARSHGLLNNKVTYA